MNANTRKNKPYTFQYTGMENDSIQAQRRAEHSERMHTSGLAGRRTSMHVCCFYEDRNRKTSQTHGVLLTVRLR